MFFFEHYGLASMVMFKRYEVNSYSFPQHFHRAFELLTVKTGHLNVTVDGRTMTVGPHSAALIFPNQLHSFESTEPNRFAISIFAPEMVADFSTLHRGQVPTDNRLIDGDFTEYLKLDSQLAQKSWLYQVLAQFETPARKYQKRTPSHQQQLLYKMIDFIEQHYEGDCSLHQAAKALGYDYAYLSRTFSALLGTSYTAYLQDYRLTKATQLLDETSLPISQIATRAGFGSLHAFNETFHRYLETTPTEYRQSDHVRYGENE